MPNHDLDTQVKLAMYDITAATGCVPNSREVSQRIDVDESEVLAAFERLHAERLLLPEPGDPGRIRMAPPFSGIPTPFPVEANGKQYYANRVWDAYGVAAALHCDALSCIRWPHRRAVGSGGEKRRTGLEIIRRAFRGAGGALAGRSHFHVSDDAPLPVGRDRECLVRGSQPSATATRES